MGNSDLAHLGAKESGTYTPSGTGEGFQVHHSYARAPQGAGLALGA